METLYIVQRSATLRVDGGGLAVFSEEPPGSRRLLARPPVRRMRGIVMADGARITSDAVKLCFGHGVNVAWLGRAGRIAAFAASALSRPFLKLRQYAVAGSSEKRLGLARAIVCAKIGNGAMVVRKLRRGKRPAADGRMAMNALRELETAAASATAMDQLMGFEGAAARTYFSGLAECFSGEIRFAGRKAHPPADPVNSLLSLAYSLLGNRIAAAIVAAGMEPHLGALHGIVRGAGALAQDLLEEFRHSVVDRFVVQLCNYRKLSERHFIRRPGRKTMVSLTDEGLRLFFFEWEKWLALPIGDADNPEFDFNPCLARQVDRWAGALKQGGYRPHRFGG
ncbi:MAG: CRISPR-associated endonuclease Cas1 [Planctomycetota bacterium]|jgi:CRISPR-associated protein Cas1|nr:CRISPR-associated endonuclease Cas1 [Planctomycetota bacterium]